MLPDPMNKRKVKPSTTASMIPWAMLRKMSNSQADSKTEIRCFEPKPVEMEEKEEEKEEVEVEEEIEDVDFLGLNKINEISDIAPVAGFDLPEINTNMTIIEVDKVYGPVYCPESSESDIYEENETKLILDSNAVSLHNIFVKNIIGIELRLM